MTSIKTSYNRRSFLKVSAAAGGGLLISFNWLSACSPEKKEVLPALPPADAWYEMNAFLTIANNGEVSIQSPNPEIGQNVKTSMPMIVAEELDVDWEKVTVVQAPFDAVLYKRQVAGGSQSIRQGWKGLRTAGATARAVLVQAAAQQWKVTEASCSTENGFVYNDKGEKLSYGDLAVAAAALPLPEDVTLKDPSTFKIIGKSKKNVDLNKILAGEHLYGIDTKKEGMVHAVVLRPPSFGLKLDGYDDAEALKVEGVQKTIKFGDKIAVLANSTWAAIKGQKKLQPKWRAENNQLESTVEHDQKMRALLDKKSTDPKRSDGNVKSAMDGAESIVERTYEAPFLPHNCLEPMNFFADVTDEQVYLLGPIQTPEWTRSKVMALLDRPEEDIKIDMTRMGGGFGRRLYGDFVLEAAEISNLCKKPVKLVFTREDDMTAGTYRPASKYKFRAALKEGKMTAYHLTGVGINMNNATRQDNFPAAAMANYLVEAHNLESNITTGAWRAPITNFLAFAEQSFLDEVAAQLGQDPVDFRLSLMEQAKNNPTGTLDYDVDKFVGVIKLAAEKSNWRNKSKNTFKGFSAYYSHNTYVAEVAEVVVVQNEIKVTNVVCAVDCGIVVNPDAAINQIQGGVIDGVGHALLGNFEFVNGTPQHTNFDKYKLIRMNEAPNVDVHFVASSNDPTGLGEPSLPPAGGAVANAIHAATGKRLYKQPFKAEMIDLG